MLRLIDPDVPPMHTWSGYLAESYDKKFFSNSGPNLEKFQVELRSYTGGDRCFVGVSSATSGLLCCLLALGISGKVAIPSFTFPATASAIYMAGAEPVPIDVDMETWEAHPEHLQAALDHHQISAYIHVRPFGIRRDLTEIVRLAESNNLPVIIDAAAGFGAKANGLEDCALPPYVAAEVYSFHATKPFAIGEGGAVSARPEVIAEIRSMANFSFGSKQQGYRWGSNSKMSEMHAAIGRAALAGLPDVLAYRREQSNHWTRLLASTPSIQTPADAGEPTFQLMPIRLIDRSAEEFRQVLLSKNVEARVYYNPCIENPPDGQTKSCQNSERLSREMISLPIGRHVSNEDRERVSEILLNWIVT